MVLNSQYAIEDLKETLKAVRAQRTKMNKKNPFMKRWGFLFVLTMMIPIFLALVALSDSQQSDNWAWACF